MQALMRVTFIPCSPVNSARLIGGLIWSPGSCLLEPSFLGLLPLAPEFARFPLNRACSFHDGVDLDSMRNDNQPRFIQIHSSDNVAIVVNEGGLPAGARFESGLVLREAIPEAHKAALITIPAGAPIVRYGVTIGYARTEILAGSWVHEALLALPEAPALDELLITEGVRTQSAPLEGFTFEGYLNDD